MTLQTSNSLPAELTRVAQLHWQGFIERNGDSWLQTLTPENSDRLQRAFALSDYVAEQLQSHPDWIEACLSPQSPGSVKQRLREQLDSASDEARFHKILREFRNQQMVSIAINDLLNEQIIEDSLAQVSALADALIVGAYDWLYQHFCSKYATPQEAGQALPMLIIGMGKLGGEELNFSSDIDLIFAYPCNGELQYRNKSMEYQQFFIRLAQKLIAALNQTTVDGQVFRVDMRLRPFGESGPLVASFAALEDYYQQQGREWERYAMVKGRILNPASDFSDELQSILRPFVYRRYIDYSVLESLRKMKQLIRQEVRRRNLTNNIKLGSGGIREIEFIVQCIQLTRGGRDPMLQQKRLLTLLNTFETQQILSAEDVNELRQAYLFLRKAEHCLQQFNDEQTQEIPECETDFLRLIQAMGHKDKQGFMTELEHTFAMVSAQFDELIGDSPEEESEIDTPLNDFWHLDLSEDEALQLLEEVTNISDAHKMYQQLQSYKKEFAKKPIGARGRESLDKLVPRILNACLSFYTKSDADNAVLIERVFQVISAILKRTAYLELLLENEGAMMQLIRLCSKSEWVSEQLARFPLLLDELLNPQALYNPTPLAHYPDLLRQSLLRIPEEDLEQQMEALRQFKLSHQLRIAAADIQDTLPVMKVSDHLTCLAETIIAEVINSAWHQMTEKYGYPVGAYDEDKQFLVVGYGKLGGIELGYSSDLDLVFLHGCTSAADTSGPKAIDSRQFYAKLAQRIMHLFNTKTGSGELYEVDLRLRPSGNSGLLVAQIESFLSYQQEEAWTWEHQALVRSRAIAGSDALRHRFNEIRQQVLCSQRDSNTLQSDVVAMRQKMRNHLDKSTDNKIDLKQAAGTIADIEFLTQYWSLLHGQRVPEVITWSDNVRIIEALKQYQLISEQWCQQLIDAYLAFRNLSHQKALDGDENLMIKGELESHRTAVIQIWRQVFADALAAEAKSEQGQ
ncbi:bifunctional [glutamate--ammonia ligase]-adenylyl-L-tyrosine phosphorylase/[glutamate--ammonia-ligase] adenylyltransferase [Planctobacterium marinum]|uniref:bifunctional [glutamate--ammonia ligase]-adenylyl-L-tyrosine phosphorylase/[glutamate--ammonia-ligase] adenylyltransferase n=1 Tax=Planctobacterium marinum TaxID=1631968 RepID=UPI001E32C315|nr:bifunctional [glutamate--ammonia ligase]-adenylyl-L-tyrosine phosphorylase/[glutamate--ammonia-ligase] adenylyltransferase [Planctobacterium marinum]MCC2605846.1 bifunctional [glutamate--ammonia ligase]-adenylyl-L-tyrosine phosphorylase/[glutamate--ammonia-ligase] adenylyltransferase [Planctobacterium marinum]